MTARSASLEGHALVDTDGAAERDAGLRVVGGELEAGLGAADGERRDGDTAVVEDLEELLEALPLLAEEVVGGDAAGSRR